MELMVDLSDHSAILSRFLYFCITYLNDGQYYNKPILNLVA